MNSQTTTPNTTGYVPGVCNINTAEIAYRRKAAITLLIITLILAAPFFIFDIPNWARLLLAFPIFLTAICALQVKNKFCVSYGAKGQHNAVEGDKIAQDIVDAAARKLDKARVRTMKLQAGGIALVVAILLVLIP